MSYCEIRIENKKDDEGEKKPEGKEEIEGMRILSEKVNNSFHCFPPCRHLSICSLSALLLKNTFLYAYTSGSPVA